MNTPRNSNYYYAKNQRISGIERIWRLFCNRRKTGYRFFAYPVMVYLCFIPYYGVTGDSLYDTGFLDQYQKLYACR